MIKLKTFLKKTRTGKVLKIVREHYLRDDLGCGSEALGGTTLSADPESLTNCFSDPHYIILDTKSY